LWLLGILGFCLRGGIVVLCLPIIVLPTQVEARLALGANLGSAGLTSGFWALFGVATVVTSIVALAVLYALARIEAAAFDRLLADGELTTDRADGRRAILPLFVIQALTLIAVVLAAVPLAATVGQATLDEILRPSSNASIYARVLGHVGAALVVLLIALPLIDLLSARATRRVLLGSRLPAALGGAVAEIVRAPLRTIATALAAWLALAAVLLGVGWALSVAWQATRATFLATTSVADTLGDGGPIIVALLLATVFVTGLGLAGFVAAVRSALWTVASLRR
jgi:hypothetical protein